MSHTFLKFFNFFLYLLFFFTRVVDNRCTYNDWAEWSPCGFCKGGSKRRVRTISESNTALATLCFAGTYETLPCGFPCGTF
jgi:hypothetical protein